MNNRAAAKIPAAVSALPKSYLALMGEFPLRPIKNGTDYDRVAKIVHRLALREGGLDAGEEAYLEVLEAMVERYDREHYAVNIDDVSPTRALRMLVEQAGMSVTELGELVGSKGAASELLSGKRKEPSKAQIAKLCARFRVDAGVFLLPARMPADAA
ncbi:MAG: helix-turn-helix domain-containing protein [Tepidisphaeraceae bacterium]|jgi:antitoxin component HigA of HigAB toxin-antitoxin module